MMIQKNNRPIIDTPGIVLINSRNEKNLDHTLTLFTDSQLDNNLAINWHKLSDTLQAGLAYQSNKPPQLHNGDDGLYVLFDGYLVDLAECENFSIPLLKPTDLIAELYRHHKLDVVHQLRGSYTCFIFDTHSQQGWLFNDRVGSQPMFYVNMADSTFIAMPKVRNLARILGSEATINRQAAVEFIISGTYYADHTIFEQIRYFPQGGLLQISPQEHSLARYWSMNFSSAQNSGKEDELIEECDALLEQAVQRNMQVTQNPVLSLSGGVDSRILLNYLMKSGLHDIPLFSYGLDAKKRNDLDIARQIAQAFNLPLTEFEIDLSTIKQCANEAVWRIDGRADTLDSANLFQLWEILGDDYDAMFQGDQCFGWHGHANNASEALNLFGRYNLDRAPRVASWIEPEIRHKLSSGIKTTLKQMVTTTGKANGNDIKDIIFFEQAVGNVQNAFAAAKRQSIKQLRPLLDEDVLQFISGLPEHYRADKHILRKVLDRHTMMQNREFATTTGLPKPRDILAQGKTPYLSLLIDNMQLGLHSELADWVRPEPILATLESLQMNAPLPPISASWWQQLPIFSRGIAKQAARATHPLITIRRLFVIDSYLKSI